MSVEFTKAADGELTCTTNGIRLHSHYNPTHEAEQFVQSLRCSFSPTYILITEPCLSYCAKILRSVFPQAKICAVRYCNDFSSTDSLWDKIFSVSTSLSEDLYSYFGDEGIVTCLYASWKPAEQAFAEEYKICWAEIKKAAIKSRNVLTTRSFFARRWTKNSIRNCFFINHVVTAIKGESPIIVCASGPSLSSSLPFIKENRSSCTIICVSSALAPLAHYDIEPDIVISTDGGYWAKKHISFAAEQFSNMVIALPSEAALFLSLFEAHPILPLLYGDGIGDDFFKATAIEGMEAKRNGTVSGTAVELALSLTSGPVFCCGLDLSPSKNFSHALPNELESSDCQKDFRYAPLETRVCPSSFKNPALDIYQSWFASNSFSNRVHRLSANWKYTNTLGEIDDCDWKQFASIVRPYDKRKKVTFSHLNFQRQQNCSLRNIQQIINQNKTNLQWIRSAVPAEAIIYERSIGTPEENNALRAVVKSMSLFYANILRAIGQGAKDDL